MDTNQIDVLLVGTGPHVLFEAWHLQRKGKKVLIIEHRHQVAGAWNTIKHPGIPEVEIGCHIWDVHLPTYRFLEQTLGLQLAPLSPPPKIVKNKKRILYDWKRKVLTIRLIVNKGFKFQFSALRKELRTPSYGLSIRPCSYLYPKKGAKDLKNALADLVKREQLPIQFGTAIRTLKIEDQITAITADGLTYNAPEIVLTSLSNIDRIEVKGKVYSTETIPLDYPHIHFRIRDPQLLSFSYDRVVGDDVLHRVSNMTVQVKDELEPDEHIVCVGIFRDQLKVIPKEQLEGIIFEKLKEQKYLSDEAECISSGLNTYPSILNDRTKMIQLEAESEGKIRVINSMNFIRGFYFQLDRWEHLLDANPR